MLEYLNRELTVATALSRREFLGAFSAFGILLLAPHDGSAAMAVPSHPAPRRGITGAKVLASGQLADKPKLIPLFDSVREIPQIVDGIRCNCGCTNPPEFRSLLSCFEGKGMARDCAVCQGQAKLAYRLHKEGKTLDQIRSAIDAKFG
ncbi:MAG: PCYCGC motif-containing (lipo)protein [Gemmatimonadaceae bacterium]